MENSMAIKEYVRLFFSLLRATEWILCTTEALNWCTLDKIINKIDIHLNWDVQNYGMPQRFHCQHSMCEMVLL